MRTSGASRVSSPGRAANSARRRPRTISLAGTERFLKAQNDAVRQQALTEADALRAQNQQLRERIDYPGDRQRPVSPRARRAGAAPTVNGKCGMLSGRAAPWPTLLSRFRAKDHIQVKRSAFLARPDHPDGRKSTSRPVRALCPVAGRDCANAHAVASLLKIGLRPECAHWASVWCDHLQPVAARFRAAGGGLAGSMAHPPRSTPSVVPRCWCRCRLWLVPVRAAVTDVRAALAGQVKSGQMLHPTIPPRKSLRGGSLRGWQGGGTSYDSETSGLACVEPMNSTTHGLTSRLGTRRCTTTRGNPRDNNIRPLM
jgi:hypothetical protein